MKTFRFVLGLTLLIFCTSSANSQLYFGRMYDSSLYKSEVRISTAYLSDYYFMGRADSAKAPYLSAAVGYYHRSGVFIRSSLSYLTASKEGRIDLITGSAGYEYIGENFVGGAMVSGYFYSDESYAIAAEMSAALGIYAGYDFDVFMMYADARLGFSAYTDIFLGLEVNRTLYLLRNRLRITPAMYANAGTQYYYSEYMTNRSMQTGYGKGKGKGGSGQSPPPPVATPGIAESQKFQLLDYEADVLVTYKIRKFRIFTSATVVFPVNPSTIITDEGIAEEELKTGFYWSAGVRIAF